MMTKVSGLFAGVIVLVWSYPAADVGFGVFVDSVGEFGVFGSSEWDC